MFGIWQEVSIEWPPVYSGQKCDIRNRDRHDRAGQITTICRQLHRCRRFRSCGDRYNWLGVNDWQCCDGHRGVEANSRRETRAWWSADVAVRCERENMSISECSAALDHSITSAGVMRAAKVVIAIAHTREPEGRHEARPDIGQRANQSDGSQLPSRRSSNGRADPLGDNR